MIATTAPLQPSPSFARPFCFIAFLFFVGALSHLFDAEGAWFVPLAALLQAIALCLLLALFLATLSALWSLDPLLTLRRAIALGGTSAIGLLLYLEIPRAELLRYFAITLALFTIASVALALLAPGLGTQPDQQWRGLLGYKNQTAWYALLALLCWLGAPKTPPMRTYGLPVLTLTLLLLWQTGSATGLVALAFGLTLLLFAHAFARQPLLRPACLALALMALASLLFHAEDLLATALDLLDRDTTLTPAMAADLARLAHLDPARISLIPINPVVTPALLAASQAVPDHPWFTQGLPIILAVGRLDAQKDHATLLAAFELVRAQRPCRLLLYGEGPLRAALEQQRAASCFAVDIALPGFHPAPFAAMARCAAFVLSSRYEGLPNALIEALACGAPIIASDCPSGPRDVLGDDQYGRLVPMGDAPALAAAIHFTLDHPIDRDLSRARGRQFTVTASAALYAQALFPGAAP